MERAGRVPLLIPRHGRSWGRARRGAAAFGLLALGAFGGVAPARAVVFMSQGEALATAFPGARIERLPFVLTDAQVAAVQARAAVKLGSRLATAYCAWHGDSLAGVAFFDTRTVRTMPGVFMVVVSPDTAVARVEVLAFHEPPDYRPPARWLARFGGRRLDARLWPQRDIRNLSGATLSARAVTESVRQSLALWEILVAPRIAGAAAHAEAPPR